MIGKFGMESGRRCAIGFVRSIGSFVRAKTDKFAIYLNLGAPFFPMWIDPFRECSSTPSSLIHDVGFVGCVSKVIPSVIVSITISVIDLVRVLTGHKFPYDAMFFIPDSVHANASISVCTAYKSGSFARMFCIPPFLNTRVTKVTVWPGSPKKPPAFSVIAKALAKVGLVWQGEFSHRVLWKGYVVRDSGSLCKGIAIPFYSKVSTSRLYWSIVA